MRHRHIARMIHPRGTLIAVLLVALPWGIAAVRANDSDPARGAVALAAWPISLKLADAARTERGNEQGFILGLDAVDEALPWLDTDVQIEEWFDTQAPTDETTVAVTSLGRPPMTAPLTLLLSRYRYPAEDGHLDAIVRFDLELDRQPPGRLEVALRDEHGAVLGEQTIAPIPGAQLHFSCRFPEAMTGRGGVLALQWVRDGQPDAEAEAAFRIAPAETVNRSGRVALTVPNATGATLSAAPMTVGVPFPRGTLADTAHLRLVDETGAELPLQVIETARWSRFGSVKWALCDFTADLAGQPRHFFLEYGPEVRRSQQGGMTTGSAGGTLPSIDAGRVRLGADGLAFDVTGKGEFRTVLDAASLLGGFVEHVEGAQYQGWGHRWMSQAGMVFHMPEDTEFVVEQSGPAKTVLRAEGWYVHAETGRRFCRFVNRYVFHLNSPVIRIFHTWVFTGDGNRDSIRNMGWRFPLREMEPVGFLSSFAAEAQWLPGYYLRQHDPDEYALFEYDEPRRPVGRDDWIPSRPIKELATGKRAAGVVAAQGNGVRLHVGVQDFWQNFPASLMAEKSAITFYQWPRYGRAAEHPVTAKDIGNVWRLWFVHEGETLCFALPRALSEGPIYVTEGGPEPRFPHGRPETVNAQGIAKTAEMWLYLAADREDTAQSVRVLKGLADETLRAVVDPEWMARSGAFYEMVPADNTARPEFERAWRLNAESPIRQVERMGVYGKWIYGDLLTGANLDDRTSSLYRTFRKSHWGWPYSWIPFARTGDTQFLRAAQAATRIMTDIAFCHYVGTDLEREFAAFPKHTIWDPTAFQPFRRIGWWEMGLIPWHGMWGPTTRCYVDKADYLWDAWHMSGYARARDVALAWARETKIEERDKLGRGLIARHGPGRWSSNLLKQYVEMYEETWDPWFLAAAHAIADLHLWYYREKNAAGHFWGDSQQTFLRYTGRPDFEAFYVKKFAPAWGDWQQTGWASPATLLAPAAFAYCHTGDAYYLRRTAGLLDLACWSVYNAAEPWYYAGYEARGGGHAHMLFTSWFHIWAPRAMAALEQAGNPRIEPLPLAFTQSLGAETVIAIQKEAGKALVLRVRGRHTISGPGGEEVAQGDAEEAILAAELPAGTYRVALGRRAAMLPISPPGTQEVWMPGADETIGTAWHYVQHWFRVPEGVESFRLEFDNTPISTRYYQQFVRQVIVWDSDGRQAWIHRQSTSDHDPQQKTLVADVNVPPGQAGRLWRLTMPGMRTMPFRLGPGLPRVLAHDRTRWFDPETTTP